VIAMTTRKTEFRAIVPPRAVHDVGGLDFGPIDREEHDPALWEKRVDAMMILLYAKKGCFTVDAMRRTIEDYGQQAYDATTYYEKWTQALRNLMVEQDILTAAEIDARMRDVARRMRETGRAVVADTIEG
jgi:hypothetical protein